MNNLTLKVKTFYDEIKEFSYDEKKLKMSFSKCSLHGI